MLDSLRVARLRWGVAVGGGLRIRRSGFHRAGSEGFLASGGIWASRSWCGGVAGSRAAEGRSPKGWKNLTGQKNPHYLTLTTGVWMGKNSFRAIKEEINWYLEGARRGCTDGSVPLGLGLGQFWQKFPKRGRVAPSPFPEVTERVCSKQGKGEAKKTPTQPQN